MLYQIRTPCGRRDTASVGYGVYKERICGCLVGREWTLSRDLHPTMIGSKKMTHRVRVDNSTISTRPILPLILVNYSFQSSGERFLGLGKYIIIIDVVWIIIIIIDGTYPTAPTQPHDNRTK